MKLNLGCSDNLLDGYLNVDRVPPADLILDLSRRGIFENREGCPYYVDWYDLWLDQASEIRAHDIFEHLPNKKATMNTAWRALQPNGILDLFVPTTDGRGAFQDPDHKTFWTPNDLFYYCDHYAEWQRFHEAYGISARFRVISQDHSEYPDKVWKLHAILECVK